MSISMSYPSMFEPISSAELASIPTETSTPQTSTETSTSSFIHTFPSPSPSKRGCQDPTAAAVSPSRIPSPSSPSRVIFHYHPNEHQHEDKRQSQSQSQSQSLFMLPPHAIYSLITSLFTALTFHRGRATSATSPSPSPSPSVPTSASASASPSRDYMMTLTPLQIQWFHILLVHYMTCQQQHQHQQPPWDDTTHILMMHGSESESHDTHGEMHEKRVEWLETHATQQQQQQQQQQQPKDVECQHVQVVTTTTIPVTSTTSMKIDNMIQTYFQKYKGQHQPTPVMMPVWDQWWAFIGSFLGILGPAFLNFKILPSYMSKPDLGIMIASFGATAVLCFSAIGSDLSQPRNIICGHMLSAIVGVSVQKIIPHEYTFVSCALAVAVAIALMNATKTLHPPGGATAMIAVLPDKAIHDLGYLYVLVPVGTGAILMLLIALIINNMPRRRTWPRFWI